MRKSVEKSESFSIAKAAQHWDRASVGIARAHAHTRTRLAARAHEQARACAPGSLRRRRSARPMARAAKRRACTR
eukprot:6176239-Pleurochrysis_carterae.AAC.2